MYTHAINICTYMCEKTIFFQGLPLLEGGVLSTRFGATTTIGSPPSFSRTRYVKDDGDVWQKTHFPGIHPTGSWHGRTANSPTLRGVGSLRGGLGSKMSPGRSFLPSNFLENIGEAASVTKVAVIKYHPG